MKTMTVTRRALFGLIKYSFEVERPHIRRSTGGLVCCWVCSNGSGVTGFGRTPAQAWSDWANWALI